MIKQKPIIRSVNEAKLWRNYLKDQYRELPQIGFQLKYIDYCTQCMPPHYETLTYLSVPDAISHYTAALIRIIQSIMKDAKRRKFSAAQLSEYAAAWSDPYLLRMERVHRLTEIGKATPIDLSQFCISSACQTEEIKRLILEMELQITIRHQAIKQLLTAFKSVYLMPIQDAVYCRLDDARCTRGASL